MRSHVRRTFSNFLVEVDSLPRRFEIVLVLDGFPPSGPSARYTELQHPFEGHCLTGRFLVVDLIPPCRRPRAESESHHSLCPSRAELLSEAFSRYLSFFHTFPPFLSFWFEHPCNPASSLRGFFRPPPLMRPPRRSCYPSLGTSLLPLVNPFDTSAVALNWVA